MTAENPILLDTMNLEFHLPTETKLKPERGSEPMEEDVVHTQLELQFDIPKKEVHAKARISVSSHVGALEAVELDGRGFEIKQVALALGDSLQKQDYTYDGSVIGIDLREPLTPEDTITIAIDYTARPADLERGNGSAISSSQGLYFINPMNDSTRVHPQVWSQGETEYNSGWFPCVDQPNEKHTQEITMTVDTAFETLSNGRLVYSIENGDGTRSDVWKQEMPHSTYLTMIALGDFAIVKDKWRDKDVWYYVDPEYKQYAMDIFGNTPEMLEFYSNILGVDYPWEKYHQVIVHDFVSGAMENTSAVVHGEFVQQTPREMIDGTHEDVIAHELFHHWFGDLITAESWTHITMNEGFATYGEYLWKEYKYGDEEARLHLKNDLDYYLTDYMQGDKHTLIRTRYDDPDEVFDTHSYQKGGRVVHMLRNELGDKVFFKGLQRYLNDNAYGSVEDDHLRLAMEAVSGTDLKWFFDQWYHRDGHPELEVDFIPDSSGNGITVKVVQVQEGDAFKFHTTLWLGSGAQYQEERIWVDEKQKEFRFELKTKPDWYALDPKNDLLGTKKQTKDARAIIAQLKHAPHFMAKLQSVDSRSMINEDELADYDAAILNLLTSENAFWALKDEALKGISEMKNADTTTLLGVCEKLFSSSKKSDVRSEALYQMALLTMREESVPQTIVNALNDSSMQVVRTSLEILSDRDPCKAIEMTDTLLGQDSDELLLWISRMHAMCGKASSLPFFEGEGTELKGIDRFLFNNDFMKLAESSGDEAVYDALVRQLGKDAFDSMTWWESSSTIQGLEAALQFYTDELSRLEEMEPSDDTTIRIAELRNKKANLAALVDEAKEAHLQQESIRD